MQAMIIREFGGPDVLELRELPDPVAGPGEVLIRVRAFGINHAETHMRKGEWPEAMPVSGIEAAGTVVHDPSGALAPGTTVITAMGGLGRTRNGSYAEYLVAPAGNVVPIETTLSWTALAAIPESYATAWSALHGNLAVEAGHTVLVRGATSALGQAAVNIAAELGARVIATTRRPERAARLRSLGARDVIVDGGTIAHLVRELAPDGVDRLLDLVGNSVLRDSLQSVRPHGRLCQAGFLGGLDPVEAFLPIVDLPSGVQVSFFGSFMLGTEAFPMSAVPFQEIVRKVQDGIYRAEPSRVFDFEQIAEAHRVMERGEALGKLVVSGVNGRA
jgi:NADPH:quinone reductase-like Zn-dependent oxidoreductase